MLSRILFLLGLCLYQGMVHADSIRNEIHRLQEEMLLNGNIMVSGEPLLAEGIVSEFYELRDFEPAWEDHQYALEVIELLRGSEKDGLYPVDYHYEALSDLLSKLLEEEMAGRGSDNVLLAKMDMLLTDGVLLYAHHLFNGKVDASGVVSTWNYEPAELLPEEVISTLEHHIRNQTIEEGLEALRPDSPGYRQLMKGLAYYQELAAAYPHVAVESDRTLRPGDQSPAVAALRNRLSEMKLLSAEGAADSGDGTRAMTKNSSLDIFDDELLQGVKSFQQLTGLEVDGVVGPATLKALNVSYEARADQIRINMDRIRWVAGNLSDDFIVVNIGGYDLRLIMDGQLVWSTDIMAGTATTQTPIFKGEMTYLVFNPTWTVPRSILNKGMIASMKADPGYVTEHNYQLIDKDGAAVDPDTLDWSRLSSNYFPYRVVQQPGENNALGLVKFMFPNEHAIYLHDTPSKHLFSKTQRAFSHGCVRVKDPLTLAELILDDEQAWNREAIDQVLEQGELRNVTIAEPLDVMIMYWTIKYYDDGRVGFAPDVYGRDPAVLEAYQRRLF